MESAATSPEAVTSRPTTTESFDLEVEPGLSLQAKLDLPSGPAPVGGWPLIVMLEGSGAIDVDFTSVVPPTKPEDCVGAGPDGKRPDGSDVPCYKIDQLYATQVASLGMAVARLGKRGVTVDAKNPFVVRKDMAVHGTGTLSKRTADAEVLLKRLARDRRLASERFYFWGISEGTLVSTLFASQHPERVGGLVLVGPVLETTRDVFRFQSVTLQFDQLLAVADADEDRRVSRKEYEGANLFANPRDYSWSDPVFRDVLQTYAHLGRPATFDTFDVDHDGSLDRLELDTVLDRDLWNPLLDAVARGDAATAAEYDSGNSLAQLREQLALPSIAPKLFALDVPIRIVVGERDLNTPASQLDWFLPAAAAASRSNIQAYVVPNEQSSFGAQGHHYGPGHVARVIADIRELGWAAARD
jgi:pimeloyl-ACP methyl ester carboxylesterase